MAIAEPIVESKQEQTAQPSPAESQPGRFRRGLLAVLVVALLASAGVLTWLAAQRTGGQEDLRADREEVMNVAEQFMLRLGTHDPSMLDDQKKLPEYRERIDGLVTTKFKGVLEPEIAAAEAFTEQAGLTRTTEVYATGVQAIDSDSATVLVAGALTDEFAKGSAQEPVSFRYSIKVLEVDGEWLVDGYEKAGERSEAESVRRPRRRSHRPRGRDP